MKKEHKQLQIIRRDYRLKVHPPHLAINEDISNTKRSKESIQACGGRIYVEVKLPTTLQRVLKHVEGRIYVDTKYTRESTQAHGGEKHDGAVVTIWTKETPIW